MSSRTFIRCYSSLRPSATSGLDSSAKKFDVMSFINRIDAMYDSKNKENPIRGEQSAFTTKRRQPAVRRNPEDRSNSEREPRQERQWASKRPTNSTQRTFSGPKSRPAAATQSTPKAGIKQNSIRLKSIDSDIGGVLESKEPRYSRGPNQENRTSRFSRPSSGGARRTSGGQQRGKFVNKQRSGQSQNKNKKFSDKASSSKKTEGKTYSLSAEEGIAVINRLVSDPASVSKYALVDSQSSLSITKNLDGNSATIGASVWSAVQRLSADASPEEIKNAIDSTVRGFPLSSLSCGKSKDLNSIAFVNAVNSNPGLPLHFKQALFEVTAGKAPVSSVTKPTQ